MNIGTPLRADIFNAATRAALNAATTLNDQTTRMGLALQSRQQHIYAGTVDPQVVARNRAANRAARRARAAHRRSGK